MTYYRTINVQHHNPAKDKPKKLHTGTYHLRVRNGSNLYLKATTVVSAVEFYSMGGLIPCYAS